MGLMAAFLSEFQQCRRGIDATNMIGLLPVEGKIQSGADTDVEHAAAGGFSDPFSERHHLLLLHHEIEHSRKQPSIVKAHFVSLQRLTFFRVCRATARKARSVRAREKRPPETDAQ